MCGNGCTTPLGGPSACAMEGYIKTLNHMTKPCYLEKLSLLYRGLWGSDDAYIECNISKCVYNMRYIECNISKFVYHMHSLKYSLYI